MATPHFIVLVNYEYNAPEWWDALREYYPKLAEHFAKYNAALVLSITYDEIKALPGFSKGPQYSRTALTIERYLTESDTKLYRYAGCPIF